MNDPAQTLIAARMTLARRKLSAFVRLMWSTVEPNTDLVWGWEHEAICDHLEAVTRGEIRRLIINIPPRSLKSTIIAVMWPAWAWLKWPWTRWLTAAYDKDLATRDAVRSRRVMMSQLYQLMLGKEQIDPWKFTTDQNVKSRYENTESGHRTTTSPDSKGTGEGGDVVLIDDPNNIKKVFSEIERDSVNDWISGTMSSRVNPTSPIRGMVIVQQRGHENDATGYLLGRGSWEHLCLTQRFEPEHPCLSNTSLGFIDPRTELGELLNPGVMSLEQVEGAEEDLGPHRFAGQHQQRPGANEGTIFHPTEWPTYESVPQFDYVFGSFDLNMKRTDREEMAELDKRRSAEVGWLLGVKGDDIYLISEKRGQYDFLGKCAMITSQRKEWKGLRDQLIEDKAAGSNVMEYLEGELDGLVAVDPGSRSKIERAYACQGFCEIGKHFHLPNPSVHPWAQDVISELKSFPFGRFDDRVDVMTQSILYIKSHGGSALKRKLQAMTSGVRRIRL